MTAQELYQIVRKEIDVRAFYDPNYRAIQKKIDDQKADFNDTARLSRLLSQILGEKLAKHILELPSDEGRSELCQQLLKDFFDEINHKLAQVQSSLDKKNGISLNPVQPSFPTERVQNVAGSLNDSRASDETIQRRCRNAVANVANTMHDSFIQVNAKFRNNAGLFVQVTRTGGAECCDWCAQVSGTFWGYNRDLREVFRRHDNCTCTITYSSSKTRSRLVGESDGAGGTTNKWVESQKSWQEKPTLPDVRPTRFTPEQAKRFETKQLQKQGLVRDGNSVKWIGNDLTEDSISGSPLPSWLFGGKKQAKDTVDSLTKSLKDGTITVEEYLSQLPKLPDSQHEIDDCYSTVNPNFDKKGVGMIYKKNCQRCVIAYEMRRRGYNVVAQPANLDKKGEHLDDLASSRSGGWSHVFGASSTDFEFPKGTDSETVKENLIEMVKSRGDGARGVVYVKWLKGSDGHVFMAENINGEVVFVDPQSGKKDVGHYLNEGVSNPLETKILFVNDREITDLVKDCVKAGE